MIKLFIATAIISLTLVVAAHAEPKVTYVGEGRYACRGSSAECAQIDQNNRREAEYRADQYRREQDRAQDYVDRERRRDDERRGDQYLRR
jgi:hypothetical protein